MTAPFRRVCVFCGSTAGARPAYAAAAAAAGKILAARGLGLVTGGGRWGMMGTVTDAALSGGAEVVGVIPGFLKDLESHHRKLKANLWGRRARTTDPERNDLDLTIWSLIEANRARTAHQQRMARQATPPPLARAG